MKVNTVNLKSLRESTYCLLNTHFLYHRSQYDFYIFIVIKTNLGWYEVFDVLLLSLASSDTNSIQTRRISSKPKFSVKNQKIQTYSDLLSCAWQTMKYSHPLIHCKSPSTTRFVLHICIQREIFLFGVRKNTSFSKESYTEV